LLRSKATGEIHTLFSPADITDVIQSRALHARMHLFCPVLSSRGNQFKMRRCAARRTKCQAHAPPTLIARNSVSQHLSVRRRRQQKLRTARTRFLEVHLNLAPRFVRCLIALLHAKYRQVTQARYDYDRKCTSLNDYFVQ